MKPFNLRSTGWLQRLLLVLIAIIVLLAIAAPARGDPSDDGIGGRPDHSTSVATLLWSISILGLLALFSFCQFLFKSPLQLTELVLVLPGSHYLSCLDYWVKTTRFASPKGRAAALQDLLDLITTDDIKDGTLRVHLISKKHRDHLRQAKQLYQSRNRVGHNGTDFGWTDKMPTCNNCVVGIITTIRQADLAIDDDTGATALCNFLDNLKESNQSPPLLLYLYYGPQPNEQPSCEEVGELVKEIST